MFLKFLGDVNFYPYIKKCLSPNPKARPKIQQIIYAYNINVMINLQKFNLNNLKINQNDEIIKYHKIGDIGVIENHNHLLTLADSNIRRYNRWYCNINQNSFSWFCKECGNNVCFECYKKYKKGFLIKKQEQKPYLAKPDEERGIANKFYLKGKIQNNNYRPVLLDQKNNERKYNNQLRYNPINKINYKMKTQKNFGGNNNININRQTPLKQVNQPNKRYLMPSPYVKHPQMELPLLNATPRPKAIPGQMNMYRPMNMYPHNASPPQRAMPPRMNGHRDVLRFDTYYKSPQIYNYNIFIA